MKYFLGLIAFVSACALNPATIANQSPKPSPSPIQQEAPFIPLSWEKTSEAHPERKPWSEALSEAIEAHLPIYEKAKDVVFFCPKFEKLSRMEKIKALGDIFVGLAYYESGFNPKSQSVDVGTKNNKDSWSVGLFSMSVTDIDNYNLDFPYQFDDLIQPIPNIELAEAIMSIQVKKQGAFMVTKSVYWAPLKPGGKYDKTNKIKVWVLKYNSKCI